MTAYRFLLGPIPFMGVQVHEVQEIDETGAMLSGAAADPAAAMAELEAEIGRVRGAATGDWRAAPGLVAALGLPPARTGQPDAVQRRTMLVSALMRSPAGPLWQMEDPALAEGALAGLSLLARRVGALPQGRSFPYRAVVDGTLEGQSFISISRRGPTVTLAVTQQEASLRALYEAAMGGAQEAAGIDLVAAVLDLSPGWMAQVMEQAFGVAFAPLLFQRRGGVREAVDDTSAILLGVMAAACPEAPASGAAGEGELAAGEEDLTCRLEPLRL